MELTLPVHAPDQLPGPHQKAVLCNLLSDPETIRLTFAWCRRIQPRFPAGADSLFACRMLFLAGLVVPYTPSVVGQVNILQRFGWRFSPVAAAGSLYVVSDTKGPTELGFVAKVSPDPSWFLAADPRMEERPYRREAAGLAFLTFG